MTCVAWEDKLSNVLRLKKLENYLEYTVALIVNNLPRAYRIQLAEQEWFWST